MRWSGRLPSGRRDTWLFLACSAMAWLVPPQVLRREFYALAHEAGCWTEGDAVSRMGSVFKRQWADMVIDEVQSFLKGRHKDLVDTTSGALGYLRRNGLIQLQAEQQEDDRARRIFRGLQGSSVAEMYGL